MPFLSDDQADRLRGLVSTWGDAGKWIKALLDDRRERIVLALRTSRLVEMALRDLGRGERDRDLERILTAAKKNTDAPWSDQVLCEKCGAPAVRVGTDGARHGLVITHPDGGRCLVE